MNCHIIMDLIPLVKDGVASEESEKVVYEHMENCPSCSEEFALVETVRYENSSIKDEKIIRAMKKSLWITQLFILIIGACIGIALTNSMGMFYNFLIMPAIGIVTYFSLKRKKYIVPLIVFVVTYIWQTIVLLIEVKDWDILLLSGGFIYSSIYAGLVCLGMMIAYLLHYAFSREEK